MSTTKKIDYLGILMGFLVLVTVGTRYADYVWAKNSILSFYTPCSTSSENCFISDDENAWIDLQLEPYKKITIREKYAPTCLQEHNCESFSCNEITDCTETFCSDDTIEDGEYCTPITSDISTDNPSQ